MPRGINKHVGDCFVSARGTGVRLTSIHRVTVARIAGLDIDIEVSNTVDLGKGELVDSEVVLEAAALASVPEHEDDEDNYDCFMADSAPSLLYGRMSRRSTLGASFMRGSVASMSLPGGTMSFLARNGSVMVSRMASRDSAMMSRAQPERPAVQVLASFISKGASAFAQLGGAAPQQVSSAGALGPAHMLGAAAVMQQLAQQAWQQVQQRAQQDVKIVEQAAARGLEAAAEKLADVAQPVDGTDQLPGPSPVQLFWEGLVGGMALGDLNKILQLTDDFADKYGPVMMYQFFSAKFLVVTDPTLADEIYSKDLIRGRNYAEANATISAVDGDHSNTFTHDKTDKEWQFTKRSIAKAIVVDKMRGVVLPTADKKMDMLLDTLDMIGETPTDARSMYSSYAVDVGHETMYGKDRQQVEGWCAKVQAAAAGAAAAGASGGIARQYGEHELMNIFAMKEIFINQMAAHPLNVVKEFRQLFQAWLAVFNKLRGTQNDGAALAAFVEATAEEIISGSYGPEETHFAAQMSRHYHAGGLSKEKLQAEVGILQLALSDTIANSLTSAMKCLCTEPEWQEKIAMELEEAGIMRGGVFNPDADLSLEALGKLPVLDACIMESMRVLPSVNFGTVREPTQDTTIGGIKVEAGTQVWIPYWSQCRSKQLWKHANEFRPERWLQPPENEQEQYTAGAASAAGVAAGGPASCPATGHGAMQDDASGGCPFLRAQGLNAAQGAQAAAASGLSGSALVAPANQPTLAQALAKFGTAAKAALGLERYTGRPGEAPQAPGTVKGTPMTPSWQGHEKAFAPFGHGARTCPGKSMAMTELRLFLVRLLSQYKVSFADPEAEEPLEACTLLTAAADSMNPGKMVFTKRVHS